MIELVSRSVVVVRTGLARASAIVAVVVAATVSPGGISDAGTAPGRVTPPDGLITGRPHVVRFRPELGAVPLARGSLTRRQAAAAAAAVASCDPEQVEAVARVPSTLRADDAAAACVVLSELGKGAKARLLLGPAELTGDGIRGVRVQRKPKGDEIVVR